MVTFYIFVNEIPEDIDIYYYLILTDNNLIIKLDVSIF